LFVFLLLNACKEWVADAESWGSGIIGWMGLTVLGGMLSMMATTFGMMLLSRAVSGVGNAGVSLVSRLASSVSCVQVG
jgi:predicted MFS family arabinose efflux permease